MNSAGYLRELLRPLGVYDLDAPFNGGELDSAGAALDGVLEELEEVARESCLTTAESWGLETVASLFAHRPVAEDVPSLRAALAALLRIGGDSFTIRAINDTLTGCGVPARARETGAGSVIVSFPGIAGIPAGFEDMKRIIEDILPAHVEVSYAFLYATWAELERRFATWSALEAAGATWTELEKGE